jgi:hypothetical protein
MKSVLDASFEDVVVYVAPTKALVNQMAAVCHMRVDLFFFCLNFKNTFVCESYYLTICLSSLIAIFALLSRKFMVASKKEKNITTLERLTLYGIQFLSSCH